MPRRTLYVAGLVVTLLLTSCGDFRQRFADGWRECAPAAPVSAALGAADWQGALQQQVITYGIAAVTCAVEAFWRAATTKSAASAAAFIYFTPDSLRADRAKLWLRSRGQLPAVR